MLPQKDAAPPSKPTHGVIYVASAYPPWQHATLNNLKQMYHELGGNFPDNRDIMSRMKTVPEAQSAMKKLMPFVQHVKVEIRINCNKSTPRELELMFIVVEHAGTLKIVRNRILRFLSPFRFYGWKNDTGPLTWRFIVGLKEGKFFFPVSDISTWRHVGSVGNNENNSRHACRPLKMKIKATVLLWSCPLSQRKFEFCLDFSRGFWMSTLNSVLFHRWSTRYFGICVW